MQNYTTKKKHSFEIRKNGKNEVFSKTFLRRLSSEAGRWTSFNTSNEAMRGSICVTALEKSEGLTLSRCSQKQKNTMETPIN